MACIKYKMQQEFIPQLAQVTTGYTGAELVLLCKEAGMKSIYSNKFEAEEVLWEDF